MQSAGFEFIKKTKFGNQYWLRGRVEVKRFPGCKTVDEVNVKNEKGEIIAQLYFSGDSKGDPESFSNWDGSLAKFQVMTHDPIGETYNMVRPWIK